MKFDIRIVDISYIFPIWALALGPMQGVRGAQPPAGVANKNGNEMTKNGPYGAENLGK